MSRCDPNWVSFRRALIFISTDGALTFSVANGDFNGDGFSDITLAGAWVLLGKGDGTFQPGVKTGVAHGYVVVGDFNSDGKPDLAVAHYTTGTLSVLLNPCASAGVHLDVVRSNTTLTLSWPLPYTNFVLESAATLDSANWQGMSQAATINNGRCEIALPLGQCQRYFRLRKT